MNSTFFIFACLMIFIVDCLLTKRDGDTFLNSTENKEQRPSLQKFFEFFGRKHKVLVDLHPLFSKNKTLSSYTIPELMEETVKKFKTYYDDSLTRNKRETGNKNKTACDKDEEMKSIKEEMKKLKDLVIILRDQQHVTDLLNNIEKNKEINKQEQEISANSNEGFKLMKLLESLTENAIENGERKKTEENEELRKTVENLETIEKRLSHLMQKKEEKKSESAIKLEQLGNTVQLLKKMEEMKEISNFEKTVRQSEKRNYYETPPCGDLFNRGALKFLCKNYLPIPSPPSLLSQDHFLRPQPFLVPHRETKASSQSSIDHRNAKYDRQPPFVNSFENGHQPFENIKNQVVHVGQVAVDRVDSTNEKGRPRAKREANGIDDDEKLLKTLYQMIDDKDPSSLPIDQTIEMEQMKLKSQIDRLKNQIDNETVSKERSNNNYYQNNNYDRFGTKTHLSKKSNILSAIIEKIFEKLKYIIPSIIKGLVGDFIDGAFYDNNYYGMENGGYYYNQHHEIVKKFNSFGLLGTLPLALLNVLSIVNYTFTLLQKNKFVRNFLIPILIIVAVSGMVSFLVFWFNYESLTGIEHQHYYNYNNNNYHKAYVKSPSYRQNDDNRLKVMGNN